MSVYTNCRNTVIFFLLVESLFQVCFLWGGLVVGFVFGRIT